MSFERYTQIYLDKKVGKTVRPMGEGADFEFSFEPKGDKSYRLFATGVTALFYLWKNEPYNSSHYHSIVDALDTKNARLAQYALNFTSKAPEEYTKRLYKKVVWNPELAYLELNPITDNWMYGISVKGKDIKVAEGGFLRMRLDVRYKHDGVNRFSVERRADVSYTMDIPEGSYDWRELSEKITLPKSATASVGVFIEGKRYSGEVYLELPKLVELNKGYNLLPDFTTPVSGAEKFDWTAQYLSRKEWPEFRVKLNGETVFEGEQFERCHINSEWEISLPNEFIKFGKNILTLENISDYHDPLPYTVHELGIIEQDSGYDFGIIATEKNAPANGKAHVLIRTNKDNLKIHAKYSDGCFGDEEFVFEHAGLHGISINTKAPALNVCFALSSGEYTEDGCIERTVYREDDGIITGTGDIIYVRLEHESVEEYLSWYLSEGIGNLLTIRPTYRWSGSRVPECGVYEELIRILNEWDMKYVNMVDGRELPGSALNPSMKQLDGNGNLGRQDHELDGAMFYWCRHEANMLPTMRQFNDMATENYLDDTEHGNKPAHGNEKFIYRNATVIADDGEDKATTPVFDGDVTDFDKLYQYKDPNLPKDTKLAHDYTVERLKAIKSKASTRHTGPSTMFKYMMEGGFDFCGAETMYTSQEPLLAFLRGASYDRGQDKMGVHHALQWSSSPQDAPEHVRRFRLALYTSYMQGITDINTEEGLWRLEEYYSDFHRFDKGCSEHKKQQQDFYSYISSHTRRGRFYTPNAIIQGRYDGWHSFGGDSAWSWPGVKDTDAEHSWELLRAVYPESNLGKALYMHNCPTDRPLGYYSSTPIGNIDAIPAESRTNRFQSYKFIAFAGYNCYDEADFDKLFDYVSSGGTLLLTRAHLTESTAYDELVCNNLKYSETRHSLSCGEPVFKTEHIDNIPISVCTNPKEGYEIILKTDEGTPAVIKYKMGKGCVILYNASAYPAHPAIKDDYRERMLNLMNDSLESESSWAYTLDKVETAVFDREDGIRDIYFLAVDWYYSPEKERTAELRIGEHSYNVSLPFGVMKKASVRGDVALIQNDELSEVISISDSEATVQGAGTSVFTLCKEGKEALITVDFKNSPYKTIKL